MILALFWEDRPDGEISYLSFRKDPITTLSGRQDDVEASRRKAGSRDEGWIDRFILAMESRGWSIVSSELAWIVDGRRSTMLSFNVPDDYVPGSPKKP